MKPHFQIPLDLPHAARIMVRLMQILDRDHDAADSLCMRAFVVGTKLLELLMPYYQSDANPPPLLIEPMRHKAAQLGRRLVDEMEVADMRSDRLGQLVRNFFECLELGKEGARLSLRAGENPDSLQRPK